MSQGWTDDAIAARNAAVFGAEKPVERRVNGERKPKAMNGVERSYSIRLDTLKAIGTVREWWFESVKLKVGDDCWFLGDFFIEYSDGRVELHDTKGRKKLASGKTKPYAEEDAIVKARSVADKFPIPVYFVWMEQNGEWSSKRM